VCKDGEKTATRCVNDGEQTPHPWAQDRYFEQKYEVLHIYDSFDILTVLTFLTRKLTILGLFGTQVSPTNHPFHWSAVIAAVRNNIPVLTVLQKVSKHRNEQLTD